MNRRGRLCLDAEQFPQDSPQCLGRFPDHDVHQSASFLTPAAGTAARDQQDGYQKHQRAHRKNCRDQNPGSQRHRTDAQKPASAASISSKHCAAPPLLHQYTRQAAEGETQSPDKSEEIKDKRFGVRRSRTAQNCRCGRHHNFYLISLIFYLKKSSAASGDAAELSIQVRRFFSCQSCRGFSSS